MTSTEDPWSLLKNAEQVYSEQQVAAAIGKLGEQITLEIAESQPLVLAVMGGAVYFAGQLLPLLHFPLEFDYVQASRYHNHIRGQHLVWKVSPGENVRGRTVLLLDDILDEGHTLAAVRDKCLESGAKQVLIAALTEKDTGRPKPVHADFVGLVVPDRYVFGCGMDVHGLWRNLPAIYALNESV